MPEPQDIVELDLHGYTLFDAEVEICETLEEAWNLDKERVLLIHGFHGGSAIKDFIWREGGLRKSLRIHYPALPLVRLLAHDPGSTFVIFERE